MGTLTFAVLAGSDTRLAPAGNTQRWYPARSRPKKISICVAMRKQKLGHVATEQYRRHNFSFIANWQELLLLHVQEVSVAACPAGENGPHAMGGFVLTLTDISKTFPGVKALSRVNLDVRAGKFMRWSVKTAPGNQLSRRSSPESINQMRVKSNSMAKSCAGSRQPPPRTRAYMSSIRSSCSSRI